MMVYKTNEVKERIPNDTILALLTINVMYFHMFNQSTESNHLMVDEIRSFA